MYKLNLILYLVYSLDLCIFIGLVLYSSHKVLLHLEKFLLIWSFTEVLFWCIFKQLNIAQSTYTSVVSFRFYFLRDGADSVSLAFRGTDKKSVAKFTPGGCGYISRPGD